jgi:hypothetical protein
MTRGHCPDDLAAEVYRRTHRLMRKRFKIPGNLRTSLPEAVGDVYMRWLGNASDKSMHPASAHVFWLVKRATTLLRGGDANVERRGRSVRCIANKVHERQSKDAESSVDGECEYDFRDDHWRAHYQTTGAEDHEDSIIEALDLAHFTSSDRAFDSWRDALDSLIARGWSRVDLAAHLGVSYPLIGQYLSGATAPRSARQEQIIGLATSDTMPPRETVTVARYAQRR